VHAHSSGTHSVNNADRPHTTVNCSDASVANRLIQALARRAKLIANIASYAQKNTHKNC
jgi:hypothetical protein